MLYYAIVFFVIALVAALFGFGGIAAGAAGIAKILFFAFLIAVMEGTIPQAAVLVNTKLLGQQAKSLKAQLKWPGVRVWNEKNIAVR